MTEMKKLLEAIRDLKPLTRIGLLKQLSPISEQDLCRLIEQAKEKELITDGLTLTEKGYEKLEKPEKTPKRSIDYGIGM